MGLKVLCYTCKDEVSAALPAAEAALQPHWWSAGRAGATTAVRQSRSEQRPGQHFAF